MNKDITDLLFDLQRKRCQKQSKFLVNRDTPLRSNKFVYSEKITLIANEKIITDFKRFFLKYTVLEIQFSSVNYALVNYTQAVLIAAFKAETVYNSLKVNKTF